MSGSLRVVIGDTWQPRLLPYFAMAMMGLMLITNVLNLKFVNIGGLSVIASQLTYVFALVLADIMAEVYGYRRVRRLLYVGLAFLVFYAICLQAAVELPPARDYPNDQAFRTIFSQTPRIVAASIAAFFVTELVNSFVMSHLKIRARARYFYGRAVASVGTAQIVNGITFFGIAFAGVMPLSLIASAASLSWMLVMLCEVIILPLTKRLAMRVKTAEGVEHYDRQPANS
jgi:hypothetical protein